jgi:hypothetical protein
VFAPRSPGRPLMCHAPARRRQVVLAYGAESDRPLGIPGEDAAGVFAAREFVWWYNAHPDARRLPVDLSRVKAAAVCGIGNVALDCARVLLRRPAELAPTDIAEHALRQLQGGSKVRAVHLFARRGPVQVRRRAGTGPSAGGAPAQGRPSARRAAKPSNAAPPAPALGPTRPHSASLPCISPRAARRPAPTLAPPGGVHPQGAAGAGGPQQRGGPRA